MEEKEAKDISSYEATYDCWVYLEGIQAAYIASGYLPEKRWTRLKCGEKVIHPQHFTLRIRAGNKPQP
jgi:hypothetical protein